MHSSLQGRIASILCIASSVWATTLRPREPSSFIERPTIKPTLSPSQIPTIQPNYSPTENPAYPTPTPTKVASIVDNPSPSPSSLQRHNEPTSMPQQQTPSFPTYAPTGLSTGAAVAPFSSAAEKALFEIGLRIIEIPVIIMSLIASYLHFKGSDNSITAVSRFHFAHAAFCISFVVAKSVAFIEAGGRDITDPVYWSECSVWNLAYNINDAFLLLTSYLFFSYWETIHLTSSLQVETRWGTGRKLSYLLCGLLWAFGEVDGVASCHSSHSYYILDWTYIVFDATLFADSAWATAFVWKLQKDQQHARFWPFVVMTLSFGTATVTEVLGTRGQNGFGTLSLLFCIAIPSYLFLYVMWRRHIFFFSVDDLGLSNRSRYTEATFEFNSPASSAYTDLLAPLFRVGVPLEVEKKSTVFESGGCSDSGGFKSTARVSAEEWAIWRKSNYGLSGVVGGEEARDGGDDDDDDDEKERVSNNSAYSSVVEAESRCASDSELDSPTGDVHRGLLSSLRFANPLASNFRINNDSEHLSDSVVVIDEDLRPAECMVALLAGFLAIVAVPAAERALQFHSATSAKLLEATAPAAPTKDDAYSSTNSVTTEMHWQYEKIKTDSDELTSRYQDWIMFLKAVSEQLPGVAAAGIGISGKKEIFKPSKEKKNILASHLPTNCQVHTTAIECSESPTSSRGGKPKHALNSTRIVSKTRLTTITFGAPAAHSMGFKMGGIRQLEAKLLVLCKQQATELRTTAEAQMRQLELRFAICSRESVVVGQALAGVVSAALDALTWCIVERQEGILLQMNRIGILVHSLSLLSTRGEECGMIDDFAGALERLSVNIRLVPPRDLRPSDGAEAAEPISASTQVMLRVASVERGDKSGGGEGSDRKTVCGRVTVCLSVEPATAYDWVLQTLTSSRPAQSSSDASMPLIKVKSVLFNLGVNEQQTISNAAGTTAIQTDINRRGVEALATYYELYADLVRGPRELPNLLARLRALVETVTRVSLSCRSKDVEMLLLSSHISRLMNGARTTSCKSAKDRTSMFQTLEVARCAASRGMPAPPPEAELKPILDELRGPNGVRLKNCELNVGRARYAFNNLQLQALPPMLRPPPASIGANES